ncbi:hypothetical protein K3495_g15323 [Podosphaera aphanis]|nr:hypothetical protein K3495_g15323 [Podosphaera aphanis]
MSKADKTDNMLSEILKQLTQLSGSRITDEITTNNGFRPAGSSKTENIFATDKGKSNVTSPFPPTIHANPPSEVKPSRSDLFGGPPGITQSDTKPKEYAQFYDAPPSKDIGRYLTDGTINNYQPARATQFGLSDQELRVKRYFPDFFTRREAENPDGPLREAARRNRVVFPAELRLRFANGEVLPKVFRMQVAMIQAMLPYTAWPMRVASEMEDDFISARRAIINGSLNWAGTVECVLKVLYSHNSLGSPLTTFARLTTSNNETTLDFARRLRRVFFNLPIDLVSGPQVRDVLNHHAPTLGNKELMDHVVQTTESIARWPQEDAVFQKYQASNSIPTMNLDQLSTSRGLPAHNNQSIMDPRLHDNDAFLKIPEQDSDEAFALNAQPCFKCGKMGHWAKDCWSNSTPNAYPSNKYSALKNKGFRRFKPNNKTFVVEPMTPNNDNPRSPADALEYDNIDQELEDLLDQVLAEEEQEDSQ